MINDIKKILYKNNPTAKFVRIKKNIAYYTCPINVEDEVINLDFQIPIEDMGEAEFADNMDSKLLIRWIVWIE